MFRRTLLSLCLGLLLLATDVVHGQTRVELAKLVRDREEVLSQFSVEVEIKRREKRDPDYPDVPRTNGVPNNGQLPDWVLFSSVELIVYSHPKWSVETRRSDDLDVVDKRIRTAFDGSVFSTLRGDLEKWYIAEISTRPSVASEAISHFRGLSTLSYSDFIENIAETTREVDGRIGVETPIRENQYGSVIINDKGTLWLDPKAGFAPVRYDAYTKRKEDEHWHLSRYWEVLEFHRDKSGVYVPKRLEGKEFKFNSPGSLSVQLQSDPFSLLNIEFRDWSVGPLPSENTFRVAFPAKITVDDERVGKRFEAIELTDWEILNETENVESGFSVRRYAAIIIIGLILLALGWYIRNRKS